MKRSMEIESILHWVYNEELIKRFSSSAEGIWDHIGFGPVQKASGGSQRYDFGIPHPDAERIEKAVDALDDVEIDWDTHHTAIMGEFDALFMAHDTILVETVRPSQLVRYHSIMRTRPAWGRGYNPIPSRIQPARGPAGSAAIVGECRGADKYTTGSHCPLKWAPSIIEVARQRANYVGWFDGLGRLYTSLRGRLEEYEATPPECSPEPWNNAPESDHNILRDMISTPSISRLPEKWPRQIASRRPQMRLGSAYPEVSSRSE